MKKSGFIIGAVLALCAGAAYSQNMGIAPPLATPFAGTTNPLVIPVPGGLQMAGHVSLTGGKPAVSACGTGSPAIDAHATDFSGTVTTGTVSTTCTVTFAVAYTSWNHCRITSQSSISGLAYTYSLSAITVTASVLGGDNFDYSCDGY